MAVVQLYVFVNKYENQFNGEITLPSIGEITNDVLFFLQKA